MPYLWRKLTPENRQAILQYRQWLKRPWHRPPHYDQGAIHYHLVGACFEHQPHTGHTPERMAEFSALLLDALPESPAEFQAASDTASRFQQNARKRPSNKH